MKLNTIVKALVVICIAFSSKINAQQSSEVVKEWTSYSQSIDVSDKEGYEFKVSVAIKAEKAKENSKAALWTRIDKKDGKTGFFRNDAYATTLTDKWQIFEIKGTVDNGADVLNIGAYCQNNGDFYFDDFKVEVRKGTEKWKSITISNSGFEEDKSKGDSWRDGISKNNIVSVKNFAIEYSNNNPYKGNKSLLVKGSGILGGNDNGKFIDVNGVSLYYETYGEGEPFITHSRKRKLHEWFYQPSR